MNDRDRTALARKRSVEGDLVRLPGVHAVGLGGKLVDGRPTGGIAIQVHVVDKRAERELDPGQRIPSEIGGIPTDVIEMPVPRRAAADLKAYDPLVGGTTISVSGHPLATGEGTLGCFARTVGDEGQPAGLVVGLTNHHVIGTAAGAMVGHPRVFDCGECCSTVIGRVLKSVDTLGQEEPGLPAPPPSGEGSLPINPLETPPPAYQNTAFQVDAGIFRLDPGMRWYADIEDIGAVDGTHDVTLEEVKDLQYQVQKRGRTTGHTLGEVIGMHVSGRHTPEGPNEVAQPYVDQIRIGSSSNSAFADGGDSGSVVLNNGRKVIALLWGASNTSALASPIGAVTSMLGIEIATAPAERILNTVPGGAASTSPAAAGGTPLQFALPAEVGPDSLSRMPLLARAGGDAGRWLRSVEEVRQLIATNTRVAAVWRNNHGPIVARYLLYGQRMPAQVGGRAFAACVERILRVLARYGSAALRADVAILRRTMALEG